jgi:hypothetical protein
MKKYLPILALVLSSCLAKKYAPTLSAAEIDQAKKYPFEVLYAESCRTTKGGTLSGWSELHREDTIELLNGYLLLAHFSGEIFEFEGDTTLSIASLQQPMDTVGYKEIFNSRFLVDSSANIDLSQYPIFSHNYNSIYYSTPLPFPIVLDPNESVCLVWVNNRPDFQSIRYRLRVTNVYSEAVLERMIDGTSAHLDFGKLKEETSPDQDLFIVELSEFSDPNRKAADLGFRLKKGAPPVNTCVEDAPIEHLRRAVFLERKGQEETSLFEYIAAAELSERSVYKLLLANFKTRHRLTTK